LKGGCNEDRDRLGVEKSGGPSESKAGRKRVKGSVKTHSNGILPFVETNVAPAQRRHGNNTNHIASSSPDNAVT
jgi:hypothetical protein